jgi:hypothetical protein
MSNGQALTVIPWVQGDLYRFEMQMDRVAVPEDAIHGDAPGSVDRQYNKGGLRLGGVIEYAQNDWLVWGSRIMTSFVIPSAPTSSDIELYASFKLWDTAHTRGNLRAGVGYTYFRYTDQQTVPNDLVAQLGPSPLLGFDVQF